MGWANQHIEKLQRGEIVSFRPHGNSMLPRIRSGQLCTVEPVKFQNVQVGDVVLCKVRGVQLLHLVSSVREGQLQISNNRCHVNGWIGPSSLYGKLIRIDP